MTKNEKMKMYYDYFKLELSQLLEMYRNRDELIEKHGKDKFHKLYNYNKFLAFNDYKTYKSMI